jgi:MFS transporter, DHA2 family, multidrug resistance protein
MEASCQPLADRGHSCPRCLHGGSRYLHCQRCLVQDPPWIKADRANLRKLDYIGLGLLTVAMGGMQIMLDKGEENDWFSSNFIRIFCFLFVAGMTGLIWWQWRAKNPIMNLRLFKYKNFAICCFLMILVGGVLNAATVLEPQFRSS